MDRIDRLLKRAKPELTIDERLKKDNPFLGKTDAELLEFLDGRNYRAPAMHTLEWSKFMYALMHARSTGGLKE